MFSDVRTSGEVTCAEQSTAATCKCINTHTPLGLAQLCFLFYPLCYSRIPQLCTYYALNKHLLCSHYTP